MRGKKRASVARSLNLILWLVFSVFALVVILICILLQNVLAGRNYRSHACDTLQEAGQRIAAVAAGGSASAESEIAAIARESDIDAYLIYDGGAGLGDTSVLSFYGAERTYRSLAEICDQVENGETEQYFSGDGEIVCVSSIHYGGRAAWLCLFYPLAPLEEFQTAFRTISIVTGLVAVVLAFATSGLVALLVTRPVTEVTENAKELARGNFDINFREDYFCSEISELSSALEHARAESSRADRMQRELIANVSHDFKTPLTMIKAYASMIREITGDNKEKRDQNAQVIIDEADRLTMLVSDVLDLSKLRAGAEEARERFDLSAETRAIVCRFDFLRETQGYKIETAIEDGIEIEAAKGRIGQVVYNLVGNAVNYTGEDKRVRVKLFRKEGAARLEVIDSGKGIPPEELDTIWDRYYRSEGTHKRPVSGTGLGLSIVKSVLLAHGFAFGVVSEQGKGSCFWVEFPYGTPAQEEHMPQKKQKRQKRRKGGNLE